MPLSKRAKWLMYVMAPNAVLSGYLIIFIAGYLPSSGAPIGYVGLILGVEGVTAVVAAVPLGIISDKRGRKSLMILANTIVCFSSLILSLADSIYLYLLASLLFGLAEASFLASWNAIIADITSEEDRTDAYSLNFTIASISNSSGYALPLAFPFIESKLLLQSDLVHRGALLAISTFNIVSTFVMFFLLRHYNEQTSRRNKPENSSLSDVSRFVLANSIIAFGAGLIIPYVPTWLFTKFGIEDAISGPILAISGATIGFASLASPLLSKRFGVINSTIITMGSSLAFMCSLAFIQNAFLACIVYVLRTMLMNMSSPLLDTTIMKITNPERRGLVSAVVAVAWRLPNNVSTILTAFLLNFFDFSFLWLIASFFYLVGILMFYVSFKNQKF